MTRNDLHGRQHPLSKMQLLSTETTLVYHFRYPETIKPDDTQRPTWSSTPFVEDANSIDQNYFSLSFSSSKDGKSDDCRRHLMVIHTYAIQRQSSPIAREDTSWLFAPLSSKDGKSDETRWLIMVICHLSSTRGKRARWHTKTNMVICIISSKIQRLSIETTLVSPRHPETINFDDTWRQTTVIRRFCYPKTIKSDSTQRPMWSSALFVEDSMSIDWDYFSFFFVNQRQASPLAHGDMSWLSAPLLSRDNRVRWHAEKTHGHLHPLSKI